MSNRFSTVRTWAVCAALLSFLAFTSPAHAARCGGDFSTFIAEISREAAAQGVSRAVIDAGVRGRFARPGRDGVRPPPARHLPQDLRAICGDPRRRRRASSAPAPCWRATPALLARVEQRFGVPKELVMAIWTMETDNGGDMGKLPVVRTLATLAHDCRRTELFQSELIAALQILQRGDLPLNQLIGAYAGEIGQTQFLPSSYIKYGVDFDGNGHVDLRRSVPDVLASTANLLKVNGWQTGQPFGLGTRNFEVMREWNRSEVYRRTLHYFAEQLR